MAITLPTNEDGSLRRFTEDEYLAMDILRRGVDGEGNHWIADFGPDGSGCTRRFSCAWDQRFNAAIYMVGAVKKVVIDGIPKISRLLPQRDPDYPQWICTKVRINPFKFDGAIDRPEDEWEFDDELGEWVLIEGIPSPTKEPVASFDRAELECTFEMVPFSLRTDEAVEADSDGEQTRYVTWPGLPGADASTDSSYIGMPGSIIQYTNATGTGAPAGTKIPFAIGFVEGTKKFKVLWRRVPFAVWQPDSGYFQAIVGNETIRGYIGAINKTLFNGYPPLTLQLLGVEERAVPDPTGIGYSWDLAFVMSYKPVPYGQLGFYYHHIPPSSPPPPSPPPPPDPSGYYQVLRPGAGKTTKDADAIGENDSLFPVKEFADLLNISAFPDPS